MPENPNIYPSKIEWDRIPTDPVQKAARVIGYPGFFGVRSVGPVGDFLEYTD